MNRPAILPELDGLRAVAAYGIVATHVAFQTATGSAVLERFDMPVMHKNSADYAAFARRMAQEEAEMVRKLGLKA